MFVKWEKAAAKKSGGCNSRRSNSSSTSASHPTFFFFKWTKKKKKKRLKNSRWFHVGGTSWLWGKVIDVKKSFSGIFFSLSPLLLGCRRCVVVVCCCCPFSKRHVVPAWLPRPYFSYRRPFFFFFFQERNVILLWLLLRLRNYYYHFYSLAEEEKEKNSVKPSVARGGRWKFGSPGFGRRWLWFAVHTKDRRQAVVDLSGLYCTDTTKTFGIFFPARKQPNVNISWDSDLSRRPQNVETIFDRMIKGEWEVESVA